MVANPIILKNKDLLIQGPENAYWIWIPRYSNLASAIPIGESRRWCRLGTGMSARIECSGSGVAKG
jgi:hypothetical protein